MHTSRKNLSDGLLSTATSFHFLEKAAITARFCSRALRIEIDVCVFYDIVIVFRSSGKRFFLPLGSIAEDPIPGDFFLNPQKIRETRFP